jgi:hypothetical protein
MNGKKLRLSKEDIVAFFISYPAVSVVGMRETK